jgi:hypothetical protein
MKIIDQTQHLINNVKDQVGGVLQDTAKLAHDFSVLVYVGVTATIKDSVNGFLQRNNS